MGAEPGMGPACEAQVFEHDCGNLDVEPTWQNGGGVGLGGRCPRENARTHGNKRGKSHTRKCMCTLPISVSTDYRLGLRKPENREP